MTNIVLWGLFFTLGNLGEVTCEEFLGSEISLHFLPKWDFLLFRFCFFPFMLVMGFLCCPSHLPFTGLEIFAPEGLDFFPGRIPSDKNPFTGLGKHWHHFQSLCSFLNTTSLSEGTHFRLFTLVILLRFLREGTPCFDEVHYNVVLKEN